MEIDDYYLVAICVASLAIGSALTLAFQWNQNRSPEILSTGILRKNGLPLRDKKYSHIFTHKKADRTAIAQAEIGVLEAEKKRSDQKIKALRRKMEDTQEDLNEEQERIRAMKTEGERRVFEKTLSVFFADWRIVMEQMGTELASQVALGTKLIFMGQVENGHERKIVLKNLDGGKIFSELDTQQILDDALSSLVETLDMDSSLARETAKLWLEIKS